MDPKGVPLQTGHTEAGSPKGPLLLSKAAMGVGPCPEANQTVKSILSWKGHARDTKKLRTQWHRCHSSWACLQVSGIFCDSTWHEWFMRFLALAINLSESGLSRDLAMVQNQWYHFGIGAPPILVCFSGDWDVHWGYGVLRSRFGPKPVHHKQEVTNQAVTGNAWWRHCSTC